MNPEDCVIPLPVDETMDPENDCEPEQRTRVDIKAICKQTVNAYRESLSTAVEDEPGGVDSHRRFILAQERARYFEKDSAASDLRSDSRSNSDVGPVKPPVEPWDVFASKVVDKLSMELAFRGPDYMKSQVDGYLEIFGQQCALLLVGQNMGLAEIKMRIYSAMGPHLDDAITRLEARLACPAESRVRSKLMRRLGEDCLNPILPVLRRLIQISAILFPYPI